MEKSNLKVGHSSTLTCKFCKSELGEENRLGKLIICNHCHNSFHLVDSSRERVKKFILAGAVALSLGGLGIGAKAMGYFDDEATKLKKSISNMPVSKVLQVRDLCLQKAKLECVATAYERLTELDPNEVTYQANYAFALTDLNRHADALKIYDKLIAQGHGAYDLLAYYAKSLEGLGQTEKAIEWMQKTLSVSPNLVDVTQSLALALNKMKQSAQAVSLLESFIERFPSSEGMLKGNLVAIQSQIQNQIQSEPTAQQTTTLRLLALRGSHHFLPIQFGGGSMPVSFLVDTGASSLVMKTEDVKALFPDAYQKAKPARASLADGRVVEAHITLIPQLRVGPWTLRNIETLFCDSCTNLAGRSLLKHFSLKTEPQGQIEFMDLKPAKR